MPVMVSMFILVTIPFSHSLSTVSIVYQLPETHFLCLCPSLGIEADFELDRGRSPSSVTESMMLYAANLMQGLKLR